MSREVTRMFQLGRNCPTTALRVVRGSWEDEFLQQFECQPPSRPPAPKLPLREQLVGFYYESRWVLLLIACQIGTLGYVFWSVHRMVHGS